MVADAGKIYHKFLAEETPFPVIIDTPAEANIGKFVEVAILVPLRIHTPLNRLLVCNSVLVRGTSRSKPFGASVTGP